MELKFKLTADDLFIYQMFHDSRSKSVRLALNIQRFLLPTVFVALLFAMRAKGYDFGNYFPLLVVSAMGWMLFYSRFFWWNLKRRNALMIEDSAPGTGAQSLSITPAGLAGQSGDIQSSISWERVQDVVEIENHFFILLGSGKAAIIPKRVFKNESAGREFLNLVERYRHALKE